MDVWLGRAANIATIGGLVATAAAVVYAWWVLRCDVRWCFRKGDHCVEETTMKVCDSHHTHTWHNRLRATEERREPRRMGWGDS